MSQLKIYDGNTWVGIPAGGVGVPSGGSTGQYLKKSSSTDYATEWANPYASTKETVTFSMSGVGNFTINFEKIGKLVVAKVKCQTNASYSIIQRTVTNVIPTAFLPSVSYASDLDDDRNWAIAYFARAEDGQQGTGEINFRPNGTFGYGANVQGVSGVTMLGTAIYFTD